VPFMSKSSGPRVQWVAKRHSKDSTTYHSLQFFAYFGIVSDFIRDQIRSLSYDGINIQLTCDGGATSWKFTVTALFLAAMNGREEFVRLLLENPNLDLNLKDLGATYLGFDGDTALSIATRNGHASISKLLKERGAE
jgi:hypothetical protein